ncbi:MAG TPA: hypothetical protein VKD00_08505 [Methyloceanibacter sp.]|nr:hypothetical protein [Methyloceanibacter sp.]
MKCHRKTSIAAVALLLGASSVTPALAVEPDVDSPAGPELPAPRYDRPDFQPDDQTGAPLERDIEGTDRLGAGPEIIVPEDDEVLVVPPPALPEY